MPAVDDLPDPDPRAPAAGDLEREVAFEAIRAQLFAGPRQPVSIGRFTITARVGHGGMGTVYAAFDPQLQRKVAIKVVRDLGGTPEEVEHARRSLEREARAAAGVSHPNVVTVYDSGRFGDGFYVAMEFVEGRTLRSWLGVRGRDWQEITAMFVGAGRGLQAAHDAGLVHCDVKPDNVLVDAQGRPKVADFGLVRWIEARGEASPRVEVSSTSESTDTHQTMLAGTPRYMAPEQRRGLPISPRCDQFSFCVALYDALLGAPPFERDDAMDVEDPGVLGRAHLGSRVPRRIIRALLVGLALAPERRHPTMSALIHELEGALASRRRRAWWAAGAALAMTAGGVGYAMADGSIDPCAGAAGVLESVWSPSARERIHAQLVESAGERMAARVTGLIDDDAAASSAMRRDSCDATYHDGTQSMELFELRAACLDRRRVTLENLVARLEQGDERLMDQAAALIEGMTPVQECEADFVRVNVMTNAAAGRNDLARSPETDAASRTAYRMLDDARLRLAEGDVDGALVMFADVETRAHAAGLRQLEAHAIRLAVGQQMLRGATDGAASRLESALGLAIEAGDHGGAALCAVLMLQAQRASANAAVDPGLLLSLGRAWAHRSTQPEVYETEVDLEAASIAVAAGGWRDALEILDECAARLAAAAIDHTIAYRIEMLRGDTLFEAGRLDEAAAVLTSLVDRLREGLGPRHVMVGDALLRLGATRRLQGDLQAARAHGLEAEAIYVERVGRDSPRAALVSAELAGVYEGLGEFTAARGALEQSIATNRRIRGADDAGAAIPLNQLAELEYEMGAHTEGLEHARAAVALARASFGPDHVYTAAFENTVGKLELATGQASAAVATLTRARTTLAADPQVNPAWSGEVAFFLAKATLAVDPRRGAEARALGREAEADLGRAQGDAPRRLLAQIATWRVAHGLDEANSSAR